MEGKTGKENLAIAVMALLLLVAFPAAGACKLEQLASVDVEFDNNGAVLLPVKVNGQSAWMILGMANGLATAWRGSAEELGLKLRGQSDAQVQIQGANVTQKVVVDSLRIGTANFARWDLYVIPDSVATQYSFHGQPVLGGLTSRFITAVDLELDLANRKVKLFKHTQSCRGQQVYWAGEAAAVKSFYDSTGLLVFPMEIDGQRVEASFNTQGRTSVISEAVTKRFFGFGHDSPGVTHETGARDASDTYRAMALTAKGLSMKNVKIRLFDDTSWDCVPTSSERNSRAIGFERCLSRAPLSIGTDMLKKLRIYIASGEGWIYFTPAAAPDPAAAAGQSGADPSVPVADGAAAPPDAAAAPAAGSAGAAAAAVR